MPRKLLTGADLSSQKIINLADGTNPNDAVNYNQLQAAIKGLVWKQKVKAATTANITLSGAQTIDTISIVAGDRVLVKDQTTASTNGIYVAAAGAWTRATDLDEAAEFTNGVAVMVEQGSANGDKNFVLTTDGTITIGTTSQSWAAIGGSGTSYTAGNGLTLSASQFSVVPKSGGGLIVDGTGVSIDNTYSGLAKRYSTNVPSGSTSATITHNLGTLDVVVDVYDIAAGTPVDCDITLTSTTVVTLGFAVAPTTGQYRCVIVG